MRKPLLALSLCTLATTSIAQIPMTNYVRTFSSTLTRGFYFQAPIDFTVTQLQVPDETNQGSYVVALYKLTAAPTGTTTNYTPIFYAFAKDAHTCVTVPSGKGDFKKGEWFAVLGAAGNESGTVHNSYGETTNPSSLLGTPIVNGLRRCGMQINIGTTKGVGGIWANAFNIARVRVMVKSGTRTGAIGCDYCPSSNGAVTLEASSTHPAIIGKEFRLLARSGGVANTGGLLAYGVLRGNVPIPQFGTICILGIGDVVPYSSGAIATGRGSEWSLGTIPATTPVGAKVVFQLALRTSGGAIPLSNGFEITTGR